MKKFIECDCHGEGLLVSYDKEYDHYTLAIYNQGMYNPKPTLWWRLKHAWRVIKSGKIYDDCIVLSPDKMKDIIGLIDDVLIMQIEDVTYKLYLEECKETNHKPVSMEEWLEAKEQHGYE